MKRRAFLKNSGLALLATGIPTKFPAPFLRNNKISHNAIVIGIDGMDPKLMRRFIDEGAMPTFAKMMQTHSYSDIRTTTPPQTPVAWSSFITGTDPGGHGIFDFIHRTPDTFTPYLSTSRSFDAKRKLSFRGYNIPLGAGHVELMRKGVPFWKSLEDEDISASIFQIPANFPLEPSSTHGISGMGTPDLLGGYGTSTLFSEVSLDFKKDLSGGRVVVNKPTDNLFSFELEGPKNSFKTDDSTSKVTFRILRDPSESSIKVTAGDHSYLLKQGEWSDWIPLSFPLVEPLFSIHGMVRLHVKQVHPNLLIYVSPINVDPIKPALPISSPEGYSRELAEAAGRFYTQGFPADTKALSNNFLSDEEFFEQAKIVLEENLAAFEYQFSRYSEGLFYFYFSSIDQMTHMFWRLMDPTHPQYSENTPQELKDGLKYFYSKMDEVVAKAMTKVDSKTTFMVVSDHGFVPFTREFNLSTWLVEQGFTKLTNKAKMEESEFYDYVDWGKSVAYAMGLNGIYLNLKGREKQGIVNPKDADKLKKSIIAKLLETVDSERGGARAVTGAYDSQEIFSHAHREMAPDVLVGYASGYRISDQAALGKFPRSVFTDRTDKWSADHCLDPNIVPGILFVNKPLNLKDPALWDMAPSLLNGFGIKAPLTMTGRVVF